MHVRFLVFAAVQLVTVLAWAQPQAAARKERAVPEGVKLIADLEYVAGGHERQKLDLYLPDKVSGPLPVVLWVHGGGWRAGDKAGGPAVFLATKGFAVASMNYRFSQHAVFPAQIHDCKAAVRWLRANSGKYSLDPARIGAWGSSAGGHLVALLGTTNGLKDLEGTDGAVDQSSDVQAVVDWFGPTDLLTVGAKDTRSELIGGDQAANPEKAKRASPMTYVSAKACPMLIMHGDKDKTVPISQSETFARALKEAGANASFVSVPGAAHGAGGFSKPEVLGQVEEFFVKQLRPSPAP
jgi:acetyl esterase/lipase